MARIRNLKPAFFKHAELYDAERESGFPLRVAYAGLWTAADREGRFKWKPRELKTDILPYDDVDMSAALEALVRHGFLIKYKVDGHEYGLIPTFKEHQFINRNEAKSAIPAPTENSNAQSLTNRAPEENSSAPSDDDKAQENYRETSRLLDTDIEVSISAESAPKHISKNRQNGHQADFDVFYEAYPKHVSKRAALKAYTKAVGRAPPEQILAGAQRYAAARMGEAGKFTKNPATWLNADCWLDETPEGIPKKPNLLGFVDEPYVEDSS